MSDVDEAVVIERVTAPAPDDLATIVALETDAFTNPWSPEALADMLRSPVTHLTVARHVADGIVGFCAGWVFEVELHINTLAVRPSHRRRGIAMRLVRFVLETAHVERATLEVRRSNLAALNLYEKLGFKATAVREGYYRNPEEDALILWWNP